MDSIIANLVQNIRVVIIVVFLVDILMCFFTVQYYREFKYVSKNKTDNEFMDNVYLLYSYNLYKRFKKISINLTLILFLLVVSLFLI